jgi:hypothetical protein
MRKGTPMTDMQRPFGTGHEPPATAGPILHEYLVVLAVLVLLGTVALAEASGLLGSLVHSISFVI